MGAPADRLSRLDERLDRLVNLDIGERGVEPLYEAARASLGGRSPVGTAAEALLAVPVGGTVIVTTGSVSRAWISPTIGENDGPSGAAVVIRALTLACHATCVLVAEEALLPALARVVMAAGLSPVGLDEARRASTDGSLASVVLEPYPLDDEAGIAAAAPLLDRLAPDLLFSTERVGRNVNGIYYNMRGRDYGMGRARVDRVFDEALARGLPVVAVGDGGNEIGMGRITEVVAEHVPHAQAGACPCGGGIGAVTTADILVTAAVSNWGCTAIAAAMAARTGDHRLLHTLEAEDRLLETMTAAGLINSNHGLVDPHVDGIAKSTHLAITELARAIVS